MPTIVFSVYNNFDVSSLSLSRIVNFTPLEYEIIIIDDCSTEGSFADHIMPDWQDRISFYRNDVNIGLTRSLNKAILSREQRDGVFFVNSDVLVGPSWAENLYLEAKESDLVGTITACTNNGTIVTIKGITIESPENELEKINYLLNSLPPLPPLQIPVPVGHCFFATEIAISLTDGFDEFFSPGYGEEVDFGLRLNLLGLHHLVSSRVFVYHFGSKSFGESNLYKIKNDAELEVRYPNHSWEVSKHLHRFRNFETLESRVRASLNQMTLLIDIRALLGGRTGTYEVIKGILESSSESKFSKISLLVNNTFESSEVQEDFECIPNSQIDTHVLNKGRFDVVFSPSQIGSVAELISLFSLATKVVVMQLDYIAADNSNYFLSSEKFSDYRDTASLTLSLADAIFFNTKHVEKESHRFGTRRNALNDINGIGNGIEKFGIFLSDQKPPMKSKDQILIIGTSFFHKNRTYALKIFSKLLEKLPQYNLVLVGPNPDFGSSVVSENIMISNSDSLKTRTKFINWVSDEGLAELINISKLVLLTSVSEGFGLVPGEAALAGTPSIFPKRHSFSEVYSEVPFFLTLDDLSSDVEKVLELLESDYNLKIQGEYLLNVAQTNKWSTVSNHIFSNLYEVAISPSYASAIEVLKIRDGLAPIRGRLLDNKYLTTIFPPGSFRRRLGRRILRMLHS